MKYKNATSLSIDPKTAEEARHWAEKERIQLSSYVQMAIEQRNKWHERQQEKETEKANLLTMDQAKKALLEAHELTLKEEEEEGVVKKAIEIAKKMWGEE